MAETLPNTQPPPTPGPIGAEDSPELTGENAVFKFTQGIREAGEQMIRDTKEKTKAPEPEKKTETPAKEPEPPKEKSKEEPKAAEKADTKAKVESAKETGKEVAKEPSDKPEDPWPRTAKDWEARKAAQKERQQKVERERDEARKELDRIKKEYHASKKQGPSPELDALKKEWDEARTAIRRLGVQEDPRFKRHFPRFFHQR